MRPGRARPGYRSKLGAPVDIHLTASMRPGRARPGYGAEGTGADSSHFGFNEAGARAPRIRAENAEAKSQLDKLQ